LIGNIAATITIIIGIRRIIVSSSPSTPHYKSAIMNLG
jgi:hypothetical protein